MAFNLISLYLLLPQGGRRGGVCGGDEPADEEALGLLREEVVHLETPRATHLEAQDHEFGGGCQGRNEGMERFKIVQILS